MPNNSRKPKSSPAIGRQVPRMVLWGRARRQKRCKEAASVCYSRGFTGEHASVIFLRFTAPQLMPGQKVPQPIPGFSDRGTCRAFHKLKILLRGPIAFQVGPPKSLPGNLPRAAIAYGGLAWKRFFSSAEAARFESCLAVSSGMRASSLRSRVLFGETISFSVDFWIILTLYPAYF